MKIGIDIDDTIVNTNEYIIKAAFNYDKLFLKNKGFHNKKSYAFTDMFYWDDDDVRSFFKYYQQEKLYLKVPVKKDAIKYINKLYDDGNYICFITYRQDNDSKETYEDTYQYLKKYGFKFNKLITNSGMKGQVCVNEEIDIFIDNSISQIDDVNKRGIETIMFLTPYNKSYKGKKLGSWKDIYNEIRKRYDD